MIKPRHATNTAPIAISTLALLAAARILRRFYRYILFFFCISMTVPLISKDSRLDEHLYREVASQLRCPSCVSVSVLESDASFSKQIREEVRRQLKENNSKKEILDFFSSRYGMWILRKPPVSGFASLAWAVPILLLVVGPVLILSLAIRRRKDDYSPTTGRPISEIIAEMQEALIKCKQQRR